MLKGWRGRRSAYFAIIGFGVVLFTFFGVSYLLSGLHSYA
jgi:ABC-type transport system involved in cytochrome c biogenesis permease subunit